MRANEGRQAIRQKVRVLSLALPDDKNPPSKGFKGLLYGRIPLSVLVKLVIPVLPIALWSACLPAAGMTVPEASVHEDGCLVARQDDVGPTGQVPAMQAKSVSLFVQNSPHDPLGAGVASADTGHYSASDFSGY